MSDMADVLRQVQKDHGHVHTYRGGAQGCQCGQRDPNIRGSNVWIWDHVAKAGEEALSAAGFGDVKDAAAKALEDAAGELARLPYAKPDAPERPEYERLLAVRRGDTDKWLRARAAAVRGEG